MVARPHFVRNSAGFDAFLNSAAMAAAVARVASEVARAAAQETGMDAEAGEYEFVPTRRAPRRAAAAVIVKDGRAIRLQASDGFLTRAAADRGFEVRGI